ncbi:MAG TPA: hypothetical protein VGJ84_04490, partial [Polyangiaceae bacterium]
IQYAESNDLAGALQAFIRWDRRAASDPYYQLAVGFALERAGDLRALVRYQAALALDSDLMVAEQLLARLAVLELGSERSRPLVDSVARKLGDRAEARALRGLLWAVGSEDTEDAPERARISVREVDELPRPLRAVPYLLEAHQAVGLSQVRAHQSLERALELADSPQMAAAVGLFAIRTGDEPLAAQAARRSSFLAPGYARAGGIQLRAALLGGRIDEAERLSIQFGTSSVAALVSAAAAYERLELRRLKSALEMLGPLENPLDDTGLAAGAEMLASGVIPSATKLELMARPVVPWGELVATDAALDSGNFELAEKLMGKWSETHGPAYQLRIARLLRYRGKTEEALRKSQALVEAGFQTPPAVIEYLYALVESGAILKAAEALEQHKERLGPSAAWFSAILLVASGQPKVAQVKLATVPLPVEQTPLMLKALAARAIAAAKDVRARPYVAAMAKRAPRHPDIAAAVALLAAR